MHLSDKLVKWKEVKVLAGSAQHQSVKWTVTHLVYYFMAKGWKLPVRYKCRGKNSFETFDGERSKLQNHQRRKRRKSQSLQLKD